MNGSLVLGLAIDERSLGALHGVRAIRVTSPANFIHPAVDDSGVLPRPKVRGRMVPARKEVVFALQSRRFDPACKRIAGRRGDLKLDRVAGIVLDHAGATGNCFAMADITDAQSHKVTAAELAVQSKVEQGKFTSPLLHLKVDPNRPDILQLQRSLLPHDLVLVPRGADAPRG